MVLADETYRSFARRDFQSIGLKIRGPAQRPDLETLRVSNLPLRMTANQNPVILSEAKDLYTMIMDDVISIPQLRDEPVIYCLLSWALQSAAFRPWTVSITTTQSSRTHCSMPFMMFSGTDTQPPVYGHSRPKQCRKMAAPRPGTQA